MKIFYAVIFFSICFSANGQTLPKDEQGKISYRESIKLESVDQDEIYRRAKTWVVENFSNLSQIVKKDSPGEHEIILRPTGECYALKSFGDTIENAGFSYLLKIKVTPEGYDYTLNEFVYTDKWKGEIPAEGLKGS